MKLNKWLSLSTVVLSVIVAGFLLLNCEGPVAPEFANPYDEQSEDFIPKADLNTFRVTEIRALQAVSGGEFVTDYGKPVTAKGVCWSTDEEPTVEDDCTNEGEGHDAFTSTMDVLEPDQTYYARAYATNEAGTIYGLQRSFTTRDGLALVTIELESKSAISIDLKGDLVSEFPITSYGICYDESPNPDMSSECVDHDGESGSYAIELAGLTAGTSYHVFAYANNEMGTGSSEILEVTTRDGITVLTTIEPFDIRATSVRTGGEITDDGGAEVTGRGVCYVEGSGEPGLSDTCLESGSGMGSFEVLLENLDPDQHYSVRAYAITILGTTWGQVREFSTGLYDWPVDTNTEIVQVTNPETGQTWMDRNLGASRPAASSTDSEAYGDLYQWGRGADGHQNRNSSNTTNLSDSDQPGHRDFILSPDSPRNWRSPQNDNLWQGVDGINNPCPPGYRLPTHAEWHTERESWDSDDAEGAFGSPLKLPMAGKRSAHTGSLGHAGSHGGYWSSTAIGSNAQYLYFFSSDSGIDLRGRSRALGGSVRCLED